MASGQLCQIPHLLFGRLNICIRKLLLGHLCLGFHLLYFLTEYLHLALKLNLQQSTQPRTLGLIEPN